MSPQIELLQLLVDTAEKNCSLTGKISLDELPEGNGIYAEVGEGLIEAAYFDKSAIKKIPVLLMCRDTDQSRCVGQLSSICNYFQHLKHYPQGETFSWINAETGKEPFKTGRDEDGKYRYSCIINCKIYN